MTRFRVLISNGDNNYYSFIKTATDNSERILMILNFQDSMEIVKIDCSGISAKSFVDLRSNAIIQRKNEIEVEIPAYGYRFFEVLPE